MITKLFWITKLHLLLNCFNKIIHYETCAQCNSSDAAVILLSLDEINIFSLYLKNCNTYEKSVFNIKTFNFSLQFLFNIFCFINKYLKSFTQNACSNACRSSFKHLILL
jgi:hypothetical protein